MPLHWHPSQTLGCVAVRCLSGRIVVYRANTLGGGERSIGPYSGAVQFQPGQMAAWASLSTLRNGEGGDEDWSAEMVVAEPNLYRNVSIFVRVLESQSHRHPHQQIASAVLDRGIYPSLSSTPPWIRLVLNMLRATPRVRDALLSWLLSVQQQAILYAHDFRESHGRINCIWPWTRQPVGGLPPEWARTLQRQSEHLIAEVVMASCYWVGRIALGMKGQYPEYTRPVSAVRRVDKS